MSARLTFMPEDEIRGLFAEGLTDMAVAAHFATTEYNVRNRRNELGIPNSRTLRKAKEAATPLPPGIVWPLTFEQYQACKERGITRPEIGRRLGVPESTVTGRYLDMLKSMKPEGGGNPYAKIKRDAFHNWPVIVDDIDTSKLPALDGARVRGKPQPRPRNLAEIHDPANRHLVAP